MLFYSQNNSVNNFGLFLCQARFKYLNIQNFADIGSNIVFYPLSTTNPLSYIKFLNDIPKKLKRVRVVGFESPIIISL